MGRPSISIRPCVGSSSLLTSFSSVVLPLPDGPKSTTSSPGSTDRLTLSTAGRWDPGWYFETPSNCIELALLCWTMPESMIHSFAVGVPCRTQPRRHGDTVSFLRVLRVCSEKGGLIASGLVPDVVPRRPQGATLQGRFHDWWRPLRGMDNSVVSVPLTRPAPWTLGNRGPPWPGQPCRGRPPSSSAAA